MAEAPQRAQIKPADITYVDRNKTVASMRMKVGRLK